MTCLLRNTIALLRALRVALHLGYGLTLTLIYPWLSLSMRRRILQRWSVELLEIFNVRSELSDIQTISTLTPGIIVTNHISWLDIFVLNALVPMRFVAKSEVRNWPLIGYLAARVQTLFIERGKPRDAARINRQIAELLQNGEFLAVFPEGTTTDGRNVGAFHASLLQPAIDAGVPVHPLAIRYQDEQGTHSLAAAYIDDLSLLESLWKLLNCRQLHVRLRSTPSLDTSACDRRTLSVHAHRQISAAVAAMHAQASPEALLLPEASFQSMYAMLLVPPVSQPCNTAVD